MDKLTKYGQPLTVISNCLRGMLTAAEGHELLSVDFSQIEARVLAWLANDHSTLKVFRENKDLYLDTANKVLATEVTEEDKAQRQLGKVATLALGYGGGVGAFQAMSRAYNLEISDRGADSIKRAWRKSHPEIVNFWYDLENAAIAAVQNELDVIPVNKHIAFRKAGSFLQCRLPSGGKLTYPYPRLETCGYYKTGYKVNTVRESNLARNVEYQAKLDAGDAWEKPTLFYRSNRVGGDFYSESTYGGSLAENVTQAIARDLLAWALIRFENNGLKTVFHVHDEIICEVPIRSVDLEYAVELMEVTPIWAGGLPLAAEGWIAERYRK